MSAGSNVILLDPDTGQTDFTLAQGFTANRLALSIDGLYLYAAIGAQSIIRRYSLPDMQIDYEIALGVDAQGRNRAAAAMVVSATNPETLIVARSYRYSDAEIYPPAGQDVVVFDRNIQRKGVLQAELGGLYQLPSADGGGIYGFGKGRLLRIGTPAGGPTEDRVSAISPLFSKDGRAAQSGRFLLDISGRNIVDMALGAEVGRVPGSGCLLGVRGSIVLAAESRPSPTGSEADRFGELTTYSVDTFKKMGSLPVSPATDFLGDCNVLPSGTFGTNGLVITFYQHSGGGTVLVFLRADEFNPAPEEQMPVADPVPGLGLRLRLHASGLVYDQARGVVWATVPGGVSRVGNSVVAIDPASGQIVDSVPAGSEPGAIVLSGDGSRLFIASRSTPLVHSIDLGSKQRQSFSVAGIPTAADPSYYIPSALAPVPGAANSVVVARSGIGNLNSSHVTVYDAGLPRMASLSNGPFPGGAQGLFTKVMPSPWPNAVYGVDTIMQYGGGQHEVGLLGMDANGIHLERQLRPLQLGGTGVSADIVTANGLIYTSFGEVWNGDTTRLGGRFPIDQSYATIGFPVLFPEQNRVVYAYLSNLSGAAAITVFDMTTKQTLASKPLPYNGGYDSPIVAAVRAGASSVAIILGQDVVLIGLDSLNPVRAPQITLTRVSPGVDSISIPASAIAGLPGVNKMAMITPSSAGAAGNSAVIFDSDTGSLTPPVYLGSDPSKVVLSPDGNSAYVALSGELQIARLNLASGNREALFTADPYGKGEQYLWSDIAPVSTGVAVSYPGYIAVFDAAGNPLPLYDTPSSGVTPLLGSPWTLVSNENGDKLYAQDNYWSFAPFKRLAVTGRGVEYLSSTTGVRFVDEKSHMANGLIYKVNGSVVDPERTRVVGTFAPLGGFDAVAVAPDGAANRVYFLSSSGVSVYDMTTKALLGRLDLNLRGATLSDLVRVGSDRLAFRSSDGQVYLVRINTIPSRSAQPPPQPKLPGTPGVMVVDLEARDIAYDAARNKLYAATPNSEAAFGDQIVTIDPATGLIESLRPAGSNPRFLQMSSDLNRLYYTFGTNSSLTLSGFSPTSEVYRYVDLNTGEPGPVSPARPPASDLSYSFTDFKALPDAPGAIAAIDRLSQVTLSSGGNLTFIDLGTNSFNVYDEGISRGAGLGARTFTCRIIAPGATGRLYCSDGTTLTRIALDAEGLGNAGSFKLLPGRGTLTNMVFRDGRLYTSTGQVLDPETGRTIARVDAQGAVAVNGDAVYWLDPTGLQSRANPTVSLRAFDTATLSLKSDKQVSVVLHDDAFGNTTADRIVPCGSGCMAFVAGQQIYISRE